MAMHYEELDDRTRESMLFEFEREQADQSPYQSRALSELGRLAFPALMRESIRSGNEMSLGVALNRAEFWDLTEEYTRSGVTRTRRRNIEQSAARLSLTEFSTWYVRGFARRLLDEGVPECEVYRGEQPKWEPGECADHEGRVVAVREIYDNH